MREALLDDIVQANGRIKKLMSNDDRDLAAHLGMANKRIQQTNFGLFEKKERRCGRTTREDDGDEGEEFGAKNHGGI